MPSCYIAIYKKFQVLPSSSLEKKVRLGLFYEIFYNSSLNLIGCFLRRKCRARKEMMSEVVDACKHPLIIHFTGSRKPWNYDCLSPLRYEYFTYVDMTAFRGTRPTTPMRWSCKLAMDRLLFTLHLKKKRYRESLGGKY